MLEFSVYVLVGFLAQLIDGSMGMAYGLSCSTFLRSMGVPSLISSSCIHIAEMFTTLFSGIAHFKFGNIDKQLFFKLSLSGVIGGIMGVIILQYNTLPKLDAIIDIYLIIMGCYILSKSFTKKRIGKKSNVVAVGLVGGFLDAIGGGGWGPIVTTNLLAKSSTPRTVIGSVNASEFFVTTMQTIFFVIYGVSGLQQYLVVIAGLMLGGLLATPLAAYIVTKIKANYIFFIVGVVIIILNVYDLFFT